jgi:predicted O-methyltransferase YrrM
MNIQEVLELSTKFGSKISRGESVELYNSVINSPPGPVVEIGSASGGSTILLIKAAEQVGKHVISIDPYPEWLEGVASYYAPGLAKELSGDFNKNILNGSYHNITQLNEDLDLCIGKIPNGLSVVFIDGLHELANVLKDAKWLYPLLVPGGWLYIHDTNWPNGQLSGTPESGLTHVWTLVDKSLFDEVKAVDSMFCGRKKS